MYLVTTEQFEVDGELFYEGVSWKDYRKATKIENQKVIKHGRLYNWYAATDPRGIAAIGWHIPTKEDFIILINYVGGLLIAGKHLKSNDISKWNIAGDNTFNFNAFGSGVGFNNTYFDILYRTILWASTNDNPDNQGDALILSSNKDSAEIWNAYYNTLASIRLIKDNNINEGDIIIDGDTYNSITIGNQVWLQQNISTTKYNNGDDIDYSINELFGAVSMYNNDENNVYETTLIEIISDDFVITYNGIDYVFPKDKVIETPRFTREQNIPFGEYQYRTHSDKHTEFFEPVKEHFGIDMKENYAAQFRDGINPHKDINGSIFKENPDQ